MQAGRDDFKKRLEKASIGFFSQEQMVNWLCKMKEDTQLETTKIAIKHEATFGAKESLIDFERVGFLSGMYDAANWYLNEITASTSITKEADYSVYDHLEKLDDAYIKTNKIPGYYQVQKDKQVKKHPFELETLDEYWQEYLELNKKHDVRKNFGDEHHLLELYHNQFAQNIVVMRPGSDVKLMLDYHYSNYKGMQIDFLNHIQFRMIHRLRNSAGSGYVVYQQLIMEWIEEKKYELSKRDEAFLFKTLVSACALFIDDLAIYKPLQDENKYNIVIRGFLQQAIQHKGWFVNDQSLGGFTDSESKANRRGIASRDFVIVNNEHQIFSAVEFFRLNYIPKTADTFSTISNHLAKIFCNEITGVSPLFMVVYCERKNFEESWSKYLEYVKQFNFADYPLNKIITEVDIKPKRTSLLTAVSEHKRAGGAINLYHLFLNVNL